MTRLLVTATAALLLAIAAGCGGDDDSSEDVAATTATQPAQQDDRDGGRPDAGGGSSKAASGSLVEVTGSQYGKILVDEDGRTLYAFDKETTERSECFGACAEAWPPFYTDGAPEAGAGVEDDLIGTTDHEGKQLVTYDGHPLYYYVEEGPNEVLCQGVEEFGGLWLVVSPGGEPIQ
jgi:predicted lipoprotein with Yx(FWY)xxD motif